MATLAELRARAAGDRPLPKAEQTVTRVEGQHLLVEAKALEDELADLVRDEPGQVAEDGSPTSAPRKAGQRPNPRIAELRDALAGLPGRLAEFQAVLGLTGLTGGEWHRWKEEHPADPESEADKRLTGSTCSASALFGSLGRFASSWDGEPLSESDWDGWLAESITYADRRDLVAVVVRMHEDGMVRVPKLSSGSSATASSSNG